MASLSKKPRRPFATNRAPPEQADMFRGLPLSSAQSTSSSSSSSSRPQRSTVTTIRLDSTQDVTRDALHEGVTSLPKSNRIEPQNPIHFDAGAGAGAGGGGAPPQIDPPPITETNLGMDGFVYTRDANGTRTRKNKLAYDYEWQTVERDRTAILNGIPEYSFMELVSGFTQPHFTMADLHLDDTGDIKTRLAEISKRNDELATRSIEHNTKLISEVLQETARKDQLVFAPMNDASGVGVTTAASAIHNGGGGGGGADSMLQRLRNPNVNPVALTDFVTNLTNAIAVGTSKTPELPVMPSDASNVSWASDPRFSGRIRYSPMYASGLEWAALLLRTRGMMPALDAANIPGYVQMPGNETMRVLVARLVAMCILNTNGAVKNPASVNKTVEQSNTFEIETGVLLFSIKKEMDPEFAARYDNTGSSRGRRRRRYADEY